MTELMMVVIYTMAIWVMTYLFSKGYNTTDKFLVANRDIGTVSGGLSIAATWIW